MDNECSAFHSEFEKMQSVLDSVSNLGKMMHKQVEIMQAKEEQLKKLEKLMEENAAKAKNKIKLEVGGQLFATSKSTLLRIPNTYFHAMLSNGKWQPDEDGKKQHWFNFVCNVISCNIQVCTS